MSVPSVSGLIERAADLRVAGRADLAFRLLRDALRRDPQSCPAFVELSLCHTARGEPDGAREAASRAVELDPESGDAFHALAWARYTESEFDAALPAAVESVRLDPDDAWNISLLALVRSSLGEHDDAMRSIDRALSLLPDCAWMHVARARILRRMGRTAEALECARTSIRLDPGDASCHIEAGRCAEAAGEQVSAAQAYRTALGLRPDWQAARDGWSRCARSHGPLQRLQLRIDRALRPASGDEDVDSPADLVDVVWVSAVPRLWKRLPGVAWRFVRDRTISPAGLMRLRWSRASVLLLTSDEIASTDRLVRRLGAAAGLAFPWAAGASTEWRIAGFAAGAGMGSLPALLNCAPGLRRVRLGIRMCLPAAFLAVAALAATALDRGIADDPEFVALHARVWAVAAALGFWATFLVASGFGYPWSHRHAGPAPA